MKNIEEIKKESEVIDMFLSMVSEDENAPLDFKIMQKDREASRLFHEVMTSKEFTNLSDESEEKKALYGFLQQEVLFLKDLKNKLN